MAAPTPFATELAYRIWEQKYRLRGPGQEGEADIRASWHRVANALSAGETGDSEAWAERFYNILEDFEFLPGGRILAGAGSARQVTLFNCFVMGTIPDSMAGIFEALKEGALTMQQGGGVGYDFSSLRPQGSPARQVGAISSGPVSFMHIWDSMCATILSTGARRGAMMATLRCDHPDIETFIDAKREVGALRHFNLSVLVSDALMQAVEADEPWPLVFPCADEANVDGAELIRRDWPGYEAGVNCRVYRRVSARALWRRIIEANYACAEPGVLFIDRINCNNNTAYAERIAATNPCGEIPLPPYGACDLGSINLTRLVRQPFSPEAAFDWQRFERLVQVAVRLMDNVIDLSPFPLEQQAHAAHDMRRIGLGITGLADALILLNLHYDSEAGRALAARIVQTLCHSAYQTSIELAKEKGAFPGFVREAYLQAPFIRRLPRPLQAAIHHHGIRNSHLIAIAPAGTISLLAGNVSSGIEPVFDEVYQRRLLNGEGRFETVQVEDESYRRWRELHGAAPLPESFVRAHELSPQAHLAMQAALQPYVDNAISKTINVPEDYPLERFAAIYRLAYESGLKGCTTYRPNPITGEVLGEGGRAGAHCCSVEREAD